MANYPTPTPVFPTDIPGWSIEMNKRPTWATLETMIVNGRRVSGLQQAYPLWEFELSFNYLKDQTQNWTPFRQNYGRHDFQRISQLFLATAGKYGQFYLDDPTDDSRLGQIIGTTDGVSTVYTAARTWGTGAQSFLEPVGGINTLNTLYFGANPVGTNLYTYSGNQITFATAPAAGQTIRLDFTFYYLCQFLEDQQDFKMSMMNLWELRSLKLRSVKL